MRQEKKKKVDNGNKKNCNEEPGFTYILSASFLRIKSVRVSFFKKGSFVFVAARSR